MPQKYKHRHLPRLPAEYYCGFAVVHWVMTVNNRATGWLDELFHARWREAMLHVLVYYDLLCPVYCLMPDHAHVIWMGWCVGSDQPNAARVFRGLTNGFLNSHSWQTESYDHVLRAEERKRGAFQAVCYYVMENPARKHLVPCWRDYPFTGAIVPGFADLHPRRNDFWEVFWKVYACRIGEA